MVFYDSNMKVLDARQQYFKENNFGDGGYHDKFVKGKLGPIPVYLPNSKTRSKAVGLHDLHHIATGYDTTLLGEGKISAWELASGGTGIYKSAIVYVLIGIFTALFINPRAVMQAYKRGKGCRNLFGEELTDSLLALTVKDLRKKVGLTEI